jgi:hypothetical protein
MTPDPIGLKSADLRNPLTLNLYNYVYSDPVNFVDPNGTEVYYGMCRYVTVETWEGLRVKEICTAVFKSPDDRSGGGGQEGRGGGTRDRSSCGRFVDKLISQAQGHTSGLSILDLGTELLLDARRASQNLGNQQIDGFQYRYVRGGQKDGVYQHVLAHAGAMLIGNHCLLPLCIGMEYSGLPPGETARTGKELSDKALDYDRYQLANPTATHTAEEAQAEIEGDLAGRWIATRLSSYLANPTPSNRESIRSEITDHLCENGGNR